MAVNGGTGGTNAREVADELAGDGAVACAKVEDPVPVSNVETPEKSGPGRGEPFGLQAEQLRFREGGRSA